MKTTKLLLISALAIICLALAGCEKPSTDPRANPGNYTEHVITLTPQPEEGGTITASAEAALAGTEITITANPAGGYKFVKWIILGTDPADEAAPTTTFIMANGQVRVIAEFQKVTVTEYTVTVSQPSEGGTIEASAEKAVPNTTIELTATPDDGYLFAEWTTTTAGVEFADATANPATCSMPERDVAVSARFEHDPTVYDEGVEIDGLIWATRNVGAKGTFTDNPEDYGELYTFEEAQEACPTGWRVPTDMELNSLALVDSEWTTENGVDGRRFGSGENTVFLPAAGQRVNGTVSGQGSVGCYWSSSAPGGDWAYYLRFNSNSVFPDVRADSPSGLSVRCVAI
jgi:uncharacterized protein (TIGR02145 family)